MSQQLPAVKGMILVVIAGAVLLVVGLVVWNRDQTDRGLAEERVRAAEARAAAAEARAAAAQANATGQPPETKPPVTLYRYPDGTVSKEPPAETKTTVTLKEEELPDRIDADEVIVAPVNEMHVEYLAMPYPLRKKYNLTGEQAERYSWQIGRVDRRQKVKCFPRGDPHSPQTYRLGDDTRLEEPIEIMGFQSESEKPAEVRLFWLSPKATAELAAGRARR